MVEEIVNTDFKKMADTAKKLSNFLIESEFTFKVSLNEFQNGLANYFDIEATDGNTITIMIGQNGFVSMEVNKEDL